MDRLTALGTGNAAVTRCYNTCFLLDLPQGYLLCDAGGGNGILVQLERAGIAWPDIHHVILTHAHCDHLLGAVWVLRLIGTQMLRGSYAGELHVHCDPDVEQGLRQMASLTLQKKVCDLIGGRILFHPVSDGYTARLAGLEATFFDIHSTKLRQFGFSLTLSAGEKLCCLGDEPYNPACAGYVAGAKWLLCEAFCLYGDRERFKPYEKHHSTVKEACELAQSLRVPNLVLWHTEDKRIAERKRLYGEEGRTYYSGALYVPDDLEVIPLN